MTKNLSHRITAFSMAWLMLLSSTGFSMDVHYCQDQLMSISFFSKAKSCHDKQDSPPCHKVKKTCHNQKENITESDKDNCCHNETVVIEKSDFDATNAQIATMQDIQFDFVAAFVAVCVFNYIVETDHQSYPLYKPPLPDRDVQVLYQTFLI